MVMAGGMILELRKIRVDALKRTEIISLMEIAQGIGVTPPEWEGLRRKLTQYDAWGFFQGEELAGFGLVDGKNAYLSGSIRLAELRYRWQYNQERNVEWMIRSLAGAYETAAGLMVLDVNIRRDINGPLYRKLGFQPTMMRSPISRENSVLFCRIKELI